MIDTCHARVVLNPRAGHGNGHDGVNSAIAVWRRRGWLVELTTTNYAGHASELAREAVVDGCDLVVAAGGDGTVNEVINGLACSATALAVLPLGTGNVWVRELHLPLDPVEVAEILLQGVFRQLDLGQAGERYFLLMAGIGFDAHVARKVDPGEKRRFGLVAYVVKALRLARQVRGTPVRLVLDGRPVRGRALMIVVGNSRLYGGFLQIAHHASPVDGLLDVVIIKGGDMRVAPLHLLSIFLRQHHFNPDLDYYRARELSIDSMVPLDVQVDGDTIGHTPLRLRVVPGALRALLPAGSFEQLAAFSSPPGDLLHSAWQRVQSGLLLKYT